MNLGALTASLGIDSNLLEAEEEMRRFQKSAEASLSAVQTRMDKTAQKFTDFGKKATMFVTAPIIAAGGYAVKMASDMNENVNKVNVAFKSSADEVRDWSKTTLTSFGIASSSALNMAALFGDMSTSMGLSTARAKDMSTTLVGLAGDMASFKNISIEQTQTALAGIFTGETESLKRLGIVMTETNLQEYALSKGIQKKIEAMTQSEKVLLRYNYVMSVTKNSQGDFARTFDQAANQTRTFGETLIQLGDAFGQTLLPAFVKGITTVNEWLSKFSSLDEITKSTIISVAAFAAAVGPVALIIGSTIKIVGYFTAAVTTLTAAMNFLKVATMSNPWGMVITLATAAGAAMYYYYNGTKEATRAQADLNTELAKYNSLQKSFKGIQSQLPDLKSMNVEQSSALKAEIEDQIRQEKEFSRNLDIEYNDRLANDKIYLAAKARYETAAIKDRNSSEAIGYGMDMDKRMKYFMDLRDLQKIQSANQLNELNSYLLQVEAAVKTAQSKVTDPKVLEAATKFSIGIKTMEMNNRLFGNSTEDNQKKLQIYTEYLNNLAAAGVTSGKTIENLANRVKGLQSAIDMEKLPRILNPTIQVTKSIQTQTDGSSVWIGKQTEDMTKKLGNMNQIYVNVMEAQNKLTEPSRWEKYGSVIQSVAQDFQSLGQAIAQASADGSVSFAEGANIIMETALTTIGVLSSLAAANMIAAESAKGLIGIATAIAGLAMLATLWGTFVKPKEPARMANGGTVPNGYPDDTYPALLTSGETVVPPNKLDSVFAGKKGGTIKLKVEGRDLVAEINIMDIVNNSF